ncbi:pleckstrin homology domain-containing family G member 1 [Clonorchis sinensis]|uniref:Pleckstrin homology domain-containing family G member 1 n=1 Tax=Clonorchis sinensis TaxID=79923 RepID=H2KPQ2_CLOSI|nr:pleckstrin homology domain-containing family G member 1 [Clonorchis sinensis]
MTAIHANEVKSSPPKSVKLPLSPVRMRSYVVGFNESSKVRASSEENVTQTPDAPVTSDMSSRRLRCSIIELIETEDSYVQHLRDLEQGYLNKLRKIPELDADQVETIFGRIPGLRKFHQMLAATLHKHATNMVELARVFINLENQFSVLYVSFCTSYPRALQILQHAERNQTVLWNHLAQCQQSLGHKLTVSNYLLKPVQRILQYRMILQACSKHSFTVLNFLPEDDIQTTEDPLRSGKTTSTGEVRRTLQDAVPLFLEAAEKMEKVGNHINEKKRSEDVIQHLRRIHLEADQWGELVLMDRFRVASKKDWRLVLLFHSAIVLCKYAQSVASKRPDQLKDGAADRDAIGRNLSGWTLSSIHGLNEVPVEIRQIFTCTNLMLIECIPKDPLAFHILPFGNPKAQRTLRAVNISVKELWCREIKRLILENYDAAIPDKVKYILLNTIRKHDPEEPSAVATGRKTSENKTNPKLPHPETATSQSYPSGLSAKISTTHKRSTTDIAEVPQSKDSVGNTIFLPADLLPDDQSLSTLTELGDVAPQIVNKKLPSVEDCASVLDYTASGGFQMPEQNSDFRCIAVEVNEERFLRDTIGSECGRGFSFASSSSSGVLPPDTPDSLNPTDRLTPPNSDALSVKQGKVNGRPQDPAETFLYIDYPGIIRHDPVSFDRTYDRYIAKARANLCLSVVDMDEIFRPLLEIFDPRSSPSQFSTRSASSHPPSVPPHKDKEDPAMNSPEKKQTLPRLLSLQVVSHKTVVADNPVTECSSPSGPNSGASSPRHVVSQIAFLHSKNQHRDDETNNLTQTIQIKRNAPGRNGISNKSPEPNPRHQATRQDYLPNEYINRNFVHPRSSSLAPMSDSGPESCEQIHRAVSNFRFRTGPPSRRLVDSHSNSVSSLSSFGSARHNTMHSTGATNRFVTSSSSINRNGGSIPNGSEYALKSTSFNTSSGKKPLCSGRLESTRELVNPSDSLKLTRIGRKKSRAPSPPLSGAPLAQEDEAFLDYSSMENGTVIDASKTFHLDRQHIHRGTLPGLTDFRTAYGTPNDRCLIGQRPPVKPPRKTVVLSTTTHEFRPLNQLYESSRRNYQTTSSEMNTIGRHKDVPSTDSKQADNIHTATQKSSRSKDFVNQ